MNCIECMICIAWNRKYESYEMKDVWISLLKRDYEMKLYGITWSVWIDIGTVWLKGIVWNTNCMNGIERYMKCMKHELYALCVCGSVSIYGNNVLSHWASSHTTTVLEFVYRVHSITQNIGSPADLLKSLLLHTKNIGIDIAYV